MNFIRCYALQEKKATLILFKIKTRTIILKVFVFITYLYKNITYICTGAII